MMHAPPFLHITPVRLFGRRWQRHPLSPHLSPLPYFPPSQQPCFIQTVRLHFFLFLFILGRKGNILVNIRGFFWHISLCLEATFLDVEFWIIILAVVACILFSSLYFRHREMYFHYCS
jgi:hypothetical protein